MIIQQPPKIYIIKVLGTRGEGSPIPTPPMHRGGLRKSPGGLFNKNYKYYYGTERLLSTKEYVIMTNTFEKVRGTVEGNLPSILTGTGVIVGVATVGYAMYAGYKIHAAVSDEKTDTKTKRNKVIKLSVPVVCGTALAVTCHVAAHKEWLRKYASAGIVYAAGKLDKDKTKEKFEDSKTSSEKRTKAASEPPKATNQKITIRDEVTGYKFETTMSDFWDSVRCFNELAQYERVTISEFYEDLLTRRDYVYSDVHDHVAFGNGTSYGSLRPEFSSEMQDDMTLIYIQ